MSKQRISASVDCVWFIYTKWKHSAVDKVKDNSMTRNKDNYGQGSLAAEVPKENEGCSSVMLKNKLTAHLNNKTNKRLRIDNAHNDRRSGKKSEYLLVRKSYPEAAVDASNSGNMNAVGASLGTAAPVLIKENWVSCDRTIFSEKENPPVFHFEPQPIFTSLVSRRGSPISSTCCIYDHPSYRSVNRQTYFPISPSKSYLIISSAISNRRLSNHFDGDEEGGSAVYRLSLKFQRPTTVQVQPGSRNRISFIGTVDVPLTVMNIKSDKFGVRTRLIDRLRMWNEMGNLYGAREAWGFYLCFRVNVTQLNFVSQQGQRSTTRKCEELEPEQDLGEAGMERYNSTLYLWQVFFTSPFEWWDNRKSKKKPSQPDFKHKDTGEALWLNPDDPPWIRKQLELLIQD
ncbi:Nbs-lrr resistance protein isoform 1 [Hibiscus syriacus]|uniref:Nbs-lrr resistance protein isoform 1 n=1 Tax=Hibiscus syriacus TaxID=106335 RepID=A0A6A3BMD4_HIBSY|nr:Nbs-lrr resistance protein isoform 1 [Hibiscus syriacus]